MPPPSLSERMQELICSGAQSPQESLALILEVLAGVVSSSGSTVYLSNGQTFQIPPYWSQEFEYYGSTNNIQTQTFKDENGDEVAVLEYTYVGGGAADDDLIATITRTS